MQLKTKEKAHCRFPPLGDNIKNFMVVILLLLQTLKGVESTKDIPVHEPNLIILRNITIGKSSFC